MPIQPENSASQETIWDFDVNVVPEILNTVDLDPAPISQVPFSHNSSPTTSVLSSAPSGLLTPTLASGSNSAEGEGVNWTDRRIFENKKRVRKSWVYFRENGSEYTTIDGKTRWRCARCK